MSAKSRRGGYEPSWTEVTIGALLSVLIGAVLGVVFLVLKPVVTVKEAPKEEERDRGAVYYIEGARETAKAKLAPAKRKTFVTGGSVVVDENELNSLAASAVPATTPAPAAKTPPPASGAKPDAAAATPSGVALVPGAPNFRIHDGAVQLAVPTKIHLFGLELNVVVQGRGGFVKSGESFVYDPATLLVGSCPVDRLPLARAYVMRKIFAAQPWPEDIAAAWSKLADVAVVGTALKLTMP